MLPTGGVAVERAVFRGHDEVAAWAAEGWKVWDKIEVSVSEIRDLGDSTLLLGRLNVRGAGSGVELDQEWGWHAIFAGGKAVRAAGFGSWRDALKARGARGRMKVKGSGRSFSFVRESLSVRATTS